MIWFFIFIFALVAFNSGIVYILLKQLGIEEPAFLLYAILALGATGLCYNIAMAKPTVKEVYELHKDF